MEEDTCPRCGRLKREGEDLCDKCMTDDILYYEWKDNIKRSHKYYD